MQAIDVFLLCFESVDQEYQCFQEHSWWSKCTWRWRLTTRSRSRVRRYEAQDPLCCENFIESGSKPEVLSQFTQDSSSDENHKHEAGHHRGWKDSSWPRVPWAKSRGSHQQIDIFLHRSSPFPFAILIWGLGQIPYEWMFAAMQQAIAESRNPAAHRGEEPLHVWLTPIEDLCLHQLPQDTTWWRLARLETPYHTKLDVGLPIHEEISRATSRIQVRCEWDLPEADFYGQESQTSIAVDPWFWRVYRNLWTSSKPLLQGCLPLEPCQ